MSKPKFTSGEFYRPKNTDVYTNQIRTTDTDNRANIIIANVSGYSLEEARANANLFSAAKDMYEILENLCQSGMYICGGPIICGTCRLGKALKKARGEV